MNLTFNHNERGLNLLAASSDYPNDQTIERRTGIFIPSLGVALGFSWDSCGLSLESQNQAPVGSLKSSELTQSTLGLSWYNIYVYS